MLVVTALVLNTTATASCDVHQAGKIPSPGKHYEIDWYVDGCATDLLSTTFVTTVLMNKDDELSGREPRNNLIFESDDSSTPNIRWISTNVVLIAVRHFSAVAVSRRKFDEISIVYFVDPEAKLEVNRMISEGAQAIRSNILRPKIYKPRVDYKIHLMLELQIAAVAFRDWAREIGSSH